MYCSKEHTLCWPRLENRFSPYPHLKHSLQPSLLTYGQVIVPILDSYCNPSAPSKMRPKQSLNPNKYCNWRYICIASRESVICWCNKNLQLARNIHPSTLRYNIPLQLSPTSNATYGMFASPHSPRTLYSRHQREKKKKKKT